MTCVVLCKIDGNYYLRHIIHGINPTDTIESVREEKMSQEEKYKLALFAVIRNSAVMPQGVELGKTMHEINTMAVAVMAKIMESCDYENLKESYESVSN